MALLMNSLDSEILLQVIWILILLPAIKQPHGNAPDFRSFPYLDGIQASGTLFTNPHSSYNDESFLPLHRKLCYKLKLPNTILRN